MRCEVCGSKIHTNPTHAIIEGAKLTVCIECSKHGKIITQEEFEKTTQKPKLPTHTPIFTQRKKPAEARVQITQEIIEDFHTKIRQAREKLGLTHEALAKKLNEKESLLRKLETGKMTPNNLLVTKLEHALKIKLLIPISEEKTTQELPKVPNRELTLGDLMEQNKKSGEEPTERKRS